MNIAAAIADVFNEVHQSYGPQADPADALADAADRIGPILESAGYCTRQGFAEIASMSGLDLRDAGEVKR